MTQEELDEILILHEKWLRREDGGQQAILSFEDLTELSLDGADLRDARCIGTNFSELSLRNVNFTGANLHGAVFVESSMVNCNFLGAELTRSIFRSATLRNVVFDQADLMYADMSSVAADDVTAGKAALDFVKATNSDFLSVVDETTVIETEPVEDYE